MRTSPTLVFIPDQLAKFLQQLLGNRIVFCPPLSTFRLRKHLPTSSVMSRPIHYLLIPVSLAPLMFLHAKKYKGNRSIMQELPLF